jgi:hypothetical protein
VPKLRLVTPLNSIVRDHPLLMPAYKGPAWLAVGSFAALSAFLLVMHQAGCVGDAKGGSFGDPVRALELERPCFASVLVLPCCWRERYLDRKGSCFLEPRRAFSLVHPCRRCWPLAAGNSGHDLGSPVMRRIAEMIPNHAIERTSASGLRSLAAAAHVHR